MNTDNGLGFEAYFDNARLNATSKEAERRVQGFSDTAVKAGEKIDDAFAITAENIKIQKDVIGQLESQLNNLNIQISKMKPGTSQDTLKQQAAQVSAELKAEKDALKQLETQVKGTEQAHVSFRTRLLQMRDALIEMEAAGLRDTEAYKKLQKEAGELKDAVSDASQQMKAMGNDERIFQGIASTVSGVTGAFSAAQGAVGLFAGENENLQKIMLKVQSLMAITIGLQQVAEMLNKDSYFSVVILAKGKEMLAIAESKLAVAMGVSTVAARVLMATLTLGLSVAITAIIVLMERFSSKQAKAAEQAKKFNEAFSDGASKSIATFQQLASEYNDLGNSIKEKKKFIEANKEAFEELGVSINNVQEADNLMIGNASAFVDAMILKAQSVASMELATEKYKEALQKQADADAEYEARKSGFDIAGVAMAAFGITDTRYADKLIESADAKADAEKWVNKQVQLNKEYQDKLKSAGIKLFDEAAEKAKEEADKAAKAAAEKAKTEADKRREKELKDYEASLKDQLDAADSVLEKMDLIKKKQAEIAGDKSELANGKASILGDASKEATKEANEQTNKLLDEYASALDRKKKLFQEYSNDIILLQKKLDAATTPEEKSSITSAITNRANKYAKDSKSSGDSEYDDLLQGYMNFEEKKQAIIDEYDEKRKKAAEFGNASLIEELNKAQAKDVSKLATDELTGSDSWSKLFSNLDELAAKDIDTLIKEIEAKFSSLSVKFDPIDLATVRQKLDQAKQILTNDNPFKQVGTAIKAVFNEGSGDAKKSASDIKKEWNNLGKATQASFDFVNDAVNSCDFLKEAIGDVGATAISSLTTLAAVSISVAAAIKTAEKASVILAIIQAALIVVQAVFSVVKSIVAAHDKDMQRSIEGHQNAVENLKKSYEALERAIDKALGTDRYKAQKDTIENLKKQQQEYYRMAEDELSKKKTDMDKLGEYYGAAFDIKTKIEETVNSIREDILGGTVSSVANDLGSAIIDAFAAGEDAAKAWGDKVNDIVGDVIKKMLVQKLIEQPVGNIINKYMAQWVDSNGNFLGFDAVMNSAKQMGDELSALGPGLSSLLSNLPDDIKKYLVGDSTDKKPALSGAIKGASEETISMLSGYANAIRINQIESISVLRNHLLVLNKIEANTSYNKFLESIDARLSSIQSADSLRSKGF